MTKRLGLILGLLMTWAVSAAEIVAWKMPLSRFTDEGLKSEGVVRLKAPPAESPFFKQGDELWDLSRLKTQFRKEVKWEWLDQISGFRSAEDFVGYDPTAKCLYFYSSNPTAVDCFHALSMALDSPPSPRFAITMNGVGQSRVLARSGGKASVSRIGETKGANRSFEIKPTVGTNDDTVELRYHFEDKLNPGKTCKVISGATFRVGEWRKVATSRVGDMEETPVRVKVEVVRPE